MQRGLGGGTIFEPVQEPVRRDRELTLGPATLGAIGVALLALCAVCFLLGYSVGHHAAESGISASLPAAGSALSPQASLQSKPSAKPVNALPQLATTAPNQPGISDSDSSSAAAASVPVPVSSRSAAAASSAEPAVRAALAAQPASAQSASNPVIVEPALAQSSGIMVQIAAVSHPEDADVLVGALRKRGYAVKARRDPADGLLHVEVGPFANRTDAYAMRQKLLNDGYNAIVQQ
jgi:cell division septation protein DedD